MSVQTLYVSGSGIHVHKDIAHMKAPSFSEKKALRAVMC